MRKAELTIRLKMMRAGLVAVGMLLTCAIENVRAQSATSQTVNIPSDLENGQAYAAFIVPDGGAMLTLTIREDSCYQLLGSSVVPSDTSDDAMWVPDGYIGSGPHIYTSSPSVLSSREWLRVAGNYKPTCGGGGTQPPPTYTFNVDVPAVDIDIEGVTENVEESTGGFVCVNDDDDDVNGTLDLNQVGGLVTNENDLVKLTIGSVQSTCRPWAGNVELKALAGGDKVKLWISSNKVTQVSLPAQFLVPTGLPTNLWVEGIAPSVTSADVTLQVSYTVEDETTADSLRMTIVRVDMTTYRPYTEGPDYENPFDQHEIPDDQEESPGAGIRVNGDGNEGANENDLIEVELDVEPFPVPSGLTYVLKRSNSNIKVWDSQTMSAALLDSGTEASITIGNSPMSVWVENPSGGNADLELIARSGSIDICSDKIHFYPFSSVVIVLGGATQIPDDPVGDPGNHGIFEIAIDLYQQGYDVHMYDEDVVVDEDDGGAAYAEVENAVDNRNVTQVAVFGYSHGGGGTHDLAVNLDDNGYAIDYAAYVDAVARPAAAQENRMPPGTAFFVNYFQENGPFELGGGPVPGADVEVNVTETAWGEDLGHGDIDDHQNVMNGVMDQLTGHVTP